MSKGHEPVNRTRRFVYIATITAFALLSAAFLTFEGRTSSLSVRYVELAMSLVETIALLYLGASVLDRSDVLGKLGDSLGRRSKTDDDSVAGGADTNKG